MLTYYDAILAPIYFILILLLLIRWKRKYYSNTPIAKYIIPCFILKVCCCVFLACIINFYYGYGDMMTYFKGSQEIWNAAKESPLYGLELIFKPIENCSFGAQKYADQLINPIHPHSTLSLFKFSGFLSIFCFGTYLPIAFIFSLLAFWGTWRIFMVFYEEYPEHHKAIALGCLFAPSALLWGTNILKDPLCMYGLGLCVTSLFAIIKRRLKLVNIIEFIIGSILLISFKDYIFYIFLLGVLFTFLFRYKSRYPIIKTIFYFITIIGLVAGALWAYKNVQLLGSLVYINFTESAQKIQNSQNIQTEEGASGYILPGLTDFSAWGIFRSYLLALNVALFRPYIWEVRNPLMLLNAVESTAILLLTFYLLIKTKFANFFKFALQKPILFFALIFSLLLAPLAGYVSFNFGTLVRYKFPMVPFFYTYLLLLYMDVKYKKLNDQRIVKYEPVSAGKKLF